MDNIYTENDEAEITELVNHFSDAMHAALSPGARAESLVLPTDTTSRQAFPAWHPTQ